MNLSADYTKHKKIIKERLKSFKKKLTEEELFYEVCFCLMAVQTKGRKSDQVVQELKKMNYYNNTQEITPLLRQHVRFHNAKSKWIAEARGKMKEIYSIVNTTKDPKIKREELIKLVKGFGMKEASHFLRNNGHNGLAILDRHILNRMKDFGVIEEIPSLSKKNYLLLEKSLEEFAKKEKINFDELDLLFWAMSTGEVFK